MKDQWDEKARKEAVSYAQSVANGEAPINLADRVAALEKEVAHLRHELRTSGVMRVG